MGFTVESMARLNSCPGVVAMPFRLTDELSSVTRLLARYHSIPMSLADACLVRMAEQFDTSAVLTLDRHFQVYRKMDAS